MPNVILDIASLPKSQSKIASAHANQFTSLLSNVRLKLEEPNNQYKLKADAHQRENIFRPRELVFVRLRRERLPPGRHLKLTKKKWSPFPISKRINKNTYMWTYQQNLILPAHIMLILPTHLMLLISTVIFHRMTVQSILNM
ncbi:hypothetical protein MA16_Dca017955 [Dendrobium catenatum]|uniref:Uncharacterized protein n=1 Tax=Dendrobium catenatum TaxID=906689 RepID=A0A2I0X9G9_9ASPA|nr:hypothetical protein MA16_Dca017955 [Dendrobium catenatum]